MSVRDKANQANSRDGQNYTKLHSDVYLRCKAKDGKGYFELVIGDKKHAIHKPIEGYLVGQAMIMSAYDEKTGDSLFSAPYYTNKKIALFQRVGKKTGFLVSGTKQQCEDKAYEMRFGGKFKTRKVYYVAAFNSKREPQIFAIETNLPMAIEVQKSIHPTSLADYLFSFEPKIFDREMKISDNCREALKPLFLPSNLHMQMGYTALTQAAPLSDEFEQEMKEKGLDLEKVLDTYIAWKKEQGIEDAPSTTQTNDEFPVYNTNYTPPVSIKDSITNDTQAEDEYGDEFPDDLPF